MTAREFLEKERKDSSSNETIRNQRSREDEEFALFRGLSDTMEDYMSKGILPILNARSS